MNQLSIAIIGGVFVYVASQYLQKFILEPLIDFKKTTTEISHLLLLNQAEIFSGGPDEKDLKQSVHFLSAKLRGFTKTIPFYKMLYTLRIFGLPPKNNILSASHCLNIIGYGVIDIGIPRSQAIERNVKAVNDLHNLLKIETTYASPVDK